MLLVLLVIFMITAPMMIKRGFEATSAENTDQIEQKAIGVTILKVEILCLMVLIYQIT